MSDQHRSRIPEYLQHILQTIARIRQYTGGIDERGFLDDPKTQDAVLRSIEIIGEAARNVERADPEFSARHSEIPWGRDPCHAQPPVPRLFRGRPGNCLEDGPERLTAAGSEDRCAPA